MPILSINNRSVAISDKVDPATPILWILRDHLGLTGTKYACGKGLCGTCTIHVDGTATRSCQYPLSAAIGKKVTTIEGLSENADHPVQQAWIENDVPQCGYCQCGQIMSAAALLELVPNPDEETINTAMAGNLCRCGTYPRIRKAIHRAAEIRNA